MIRLLFISGWGFTGEVFRKVAENLIGVESDLISVGELGDDFAKGIINRLEEVEYDIVIGWSMGGIVALEAALIAPSLFNKLVITSGTACFTSSSENPHGKPKSEIRKLRQQVNANPEQALLEFAKLATPKNFSILEKFLNLNRLVCGLEYLEKTNLLEKVSKISVPTLVIHGKGDSVIPFEAGELLASKLQNAEFECMEGSSHCCFVDNGAEVAALIGKFIL